MTLLFEGKHDFTVLTRKRDYTGVTQKLVFIILVGKHDFMGFDKKHNFVVLTEKRDFTNLAENMFSYFIFNL